MIKYQTLFLQDDTIELYKNDKLSVRPYLVRLTTWNNYYDLRCSEDDLKQLVNTIITFLENKNENNH